MKKVRFLGRKWICHSNTEQYNRAWGKLILVGRTYEEVVPEIHCDNKTLPINFLGDTLYVDKQCFKLQEDGKGQG